MKEAQIQGCPTPRHQGQLLWGCGSEQSWGQSLGKALPEEMKKLLMGSQEEADKSDSFLPSVSPYSLIPLRPLLMTMQAPAGCIQMTQTQQLS